MKSGINSAFGALAMHEESTEIIGYMEILNIPS